jgi:peptidyl-dipeptidase A
VKRQSILSAALVLIVGCAGARAPESADARRAPTVEDARKFLGDVDKELRRIWTASSRASWVNQTFITDDTDALSASAEEENMAYLGRVIKEATRFDGLALPPDLARQMHLLKIGITLPAPEDAAKRSELANLEITMQSAYGKGKYCPPRLQGKCLTLNDLEKTMATSRNWIKTVPKRSFASCRRR